MLSIRDLLDAGTLNEEMATYLLAAISNGNSFLVGSRPGGAGKTTIMAALLNFIPDYDIIPTENNHVIEKGLHDDEPKCFVAHEIGAGRWYAYIWGQDVTNFLKLTDKHIVAGNLHADDIDEVLETDGIDEDNLTNLHILIFLKLDGSMWSQKRRISSIFENQGGNGKDGFRLLFTWNEREDVFEKLADSKLVDPSELERSKGIIQTVIDQDLRTIEEVRSMVLDATSRSD